MTTTLTYWFGLTSTTDRQLTYNRPGLLGNALALLGHDRKKRIHTIPVNLAPRDGRQAAVVGSIDTGRGGVVSGVCACVCLHFLGGITKQKHSHKLELRRWRLLIYPQARWFQYRVGQDVLASSP